MSSKSNKEYGRKPYLFDSYDDMMRTQSELQATSSGKSFKHSEMKKPYLFDNYEQMERMYSPQSGGVTLYPTSELWQGRDLEDIGQYPLGGEGEGKGKGEWDKEKCPGGCPGCFTDKPIPLMGCQTGDGMIYSSSFVVCNKAGWKPKLTSIEPTDELIILGRIPDKSGCGCDCYEMKFGFNCKGTNWEGKGNDGRPIRNLSVECAEGEPGGSFYPCEFCLAGLQIVGVDTILKGGSTDYSLVSDNCIEDSKFAGINWKLSADAGSSIGSSTLNFTGNTWGATLTAGNDACGSLKITAQCWDTEVTQYVRVADAGKWETTSLENAVPPCSGLALTFNCEIISGGNKTRYWYNCTGVFVAGCLSAAPCYDTVSCANFPFIDTIIIGHYDWVCL